MSCNLESELAGVCKELAASRLVVAIADSIESNLMTWYLDPNGTVLVQKAFEDLRKALFEVEKIRGKKCQ